MNDLDDLLADGFLFRVPAWTISHCTPDGKIRVAALEMEIDGHDRHVFPVFTDDDQAATYRDWFNASSSRTYDVARINDPPELIRWITISKAARLTHVAIDYTRLQSRGREGAHVGTIEDFQRFAERMRE